MNMEQWARVRRKILVDGQSKRSVMSEEGLHWESLQKMLSHSRPPGYRRLNKRVRKIDGYVEWIRQIMDADREVPRKQRHTANACALMASMSITAPGCNCRETVMKSNIASGRRS